MVANKPVQVKHGKHGKVAFLSAGRVVLSLSAGRVVLSLSAGRVVLSLSFSFVCHLHTCIMVVDKSIIFYPTWGGGGGSVDKIRNNVLTLKMIEN